MRKFYTWLFICAVILPSCKKQLTKEPSSEVLLAPPPCTGNTWTLTPNYPLVNTTDFGRFIFVYNNKVYLPTPAQNKVYIYDGSSWTSVNSVIPYGGFNAGFCFTIGDKGYIAAGGSGNGQKLWEYSITTNSWIQKETFPGGTRFFTSFFTIGTKAYVVGGNYGDNYFRDVWEYDPLDATPWTQKASIPTSYFAKAAATGFTIGTKGYIVGGYYKTPANPAILYSKNLLEYNPITDSWTQKADFPGAGRAHTAAFAIGSSGYAGIGVGTSNVVFNDFYKFNPSTNSWTPIANHPFGVSTALGCTLNSKGYTVGEGRVYKYTPLTCFGSSPLQ